VLYRGEMLALAEFLPLKSDNWITCGNALRLDWLSLCPPTGKGVTVQREDLDLWQETRDQAEIDFVNEGGEIYICGNPPYKGARKQESSEKSDLSLVFAKNPDFKDADYVSGWFLKASEYSELTNAKFSLVATSSVCQGEQVQFIWPRMWQRNQELFFAYVPFKWANNAANNAGVFVTVVGIRNRSNEPKYIFDESQKRSVSNISPYITDGPNTIVRTTKLPLLGVIPKMIMGNMARDDGNLILTREEARHLVAAYPEAEPFLMPLIGTKEIVNGVSRIAIHLNSVDENNWSKIPQILERVLAVRKFRQESKAKTTNGYVNVAHRFAQYCHRNEIAIALPSVTPEDRAYITPLLLREGVMVTNLAYLIYEFSIELFALLSSRMHIIWVIAVSGRLGSGIRYTPTVSYHTFPFPTLTEQNKIDLTHSAEDILLAREHYFPATIADMYDRDRMDSEFPLVRQAHERNDEIIERIYIGRQFKNDTERLEKLFEMYSKMTSKQETGKPSKRKTKS